MLRHKISVCMAVLFVSIAVAAGCRNEEAQPTLATSAGTFSGQHPIQVLCTTGPVTDMLQNLGGEHLEVTGLMGPGVDPHLYRAVPADIERLSAADMIFYNGLHLEGRMADLFEQLSHRKPTFAVTHALVESKDSRLRTPL